MCGYQFLWAKALTPVVEIGSVIPLLLPDFSAVHDARMHQCIKAECGTLLLLTTGFLFESVGKANNSKVAHLRLSSNHFTLECSGCCVFFNISYLMTLHFDISA